MRATRAVLSFGSVVEWLRSSSRRVWWTTFVLVACVAGLWALANPPFASPDEPAHLIRAVALDHGELTGKTASRRLFEEAGRGDKTNLQVRVPEVFARVSRTGTPCFAFQPEVTAECLQVTGSSRDAEALTTAARHPPAYYAIAGVASWVPQPGSRTVYLMRFISVLLTSAFIATAMTALRRTAAPRLLATGLLVAITPMVLFVSGTVNPSVPEIAASLALWVCGLVLVSQAQDRVDSRLVTAVGIAGCVLALSRQLAPLWLGLIALTLLACANRASLRNLARSGWARFWAALVVACTAAQLAWDLIFKPLDASRLGRPRINVPESEVLRSGLGATFSRYREMVGLFGWLDTPSPVLTYLLWTAALGLLVLLAVMWAKRRHVAALVALLVATVVVPVALESRAYRDVGGTFWQGRYTLPLAVGIPILAAAAISSTERARQLLQPRLFLGVGAILAIGHVLAFSQNLRRYTVGYDGEIQFWKNAKWSPPVSPLLITIAYVVAVVAFIAWGLVFCHTPDRAPEDKNLAVDAPLRREPELTP
jgi:Predicted membrane protein (DUF2142)